MAGELWSKNRIDVASTRCRVFPIDSYTARDDVGTPVHHLNGACTLTRTSSCRSRRLGLHCGVRLSRWSNNLLVTPSGSIGLCFRLWSTSKDEFRVGDIVTDDKGAAVSALIAEVPNETAEESVVSSSDSGATVILADRYDRIPSTDSVYGLVFDPVLRRSYPNWQSDQTRTALAAYRTGSFRSAANVRPESVLARIDEDEDMYLIDPR